MIKKIVSLLFVSLVLFFLVGCHLDIKSDIDYPAGLFKQTLKKIEALQAKASGPVSNLNLLVYESDDRQMVSLSLPVTTTKEAIKWASNWESQGQKEKLEKYTKKIGGLKLEKLDFLDRMGPGLLMEVEADDPKEKVHVLIWLD